MYYIGIDPGVNGGIAVLKLDGSVEFAVKMPATDRDVLDLFDSFYDEDGTRARDGLIVRAMIERVHSSPQMGVVSAFTFGRGYGALQMALTARSIPFDEVTPQKWQAAMSCRSGGDKNVTKARAQALFPDVKCTHAISDALLIAEFARRWHASVTTRSMWPPGTRQAREDAGLPVLALKVGAK